MGNLEYQWFNERFLHGLERAIILLIRVCIFDRMNFFWKPCSTARQSERRLERPAVIPYTCRETTKVASGSWEPEYFYGITVLE